MAAVASWRDAQLQWDKEAQAAGSISAGVLPSELRNFTQVIHRMPPSRMKPAELRKLKTDEFPKSGCFYAVRDGRFTEQVFRAVAGSCRRLTGSTGAVAMALRRRWGCQVEIWPLGRPVQTLFDEAI